MVEISPAPAYNSWWQFRSDAWSRLEEASGRLASALARGLPVDGPARASAEQLDALAPIEQFWAFPGPAAFRRIRDLLGTGSYDRFARLVARVNRALVTESYRGGTGWLAEEGEHEQARPDSAADPPPRPGPTSRCWSSRR